MMRVAEVAGLRWLTLADCDRRAAEVGLGYRAASKAVRRGELPARRVGARMLIEDADLAAWLREPGSEVKPAARGRYQYRGLA